MTRLQAVMALASLLALAGPALAANDFAYVEDARPILAAGAVVVDTRPLAACQAHSVPGARCLPATEALGPHRRLASWRDVLWLFGTAGLRGDETVLVVGQDPQHRDFVAGLLYLAGQKAVRVHAGSAARALPEGAAAAPGRSRDFARGTVFQAPMRDQLVVLGTELRSMQPPPRLVDGRSDSEFWGETIRAARGGHLPGATSLPALALRATADRSATLLPTGSPVAYAHDAVESIAYFTLLRAGFGVDARVYVEGWAEWAADGTLPADAATHPDRAPAPAPATAHTGPAWRHGTSLWLAIAALGLAAAFAAGLAFGRRRHA